MYNIFENTILESKWYFGLKMVANIIYFKVNSHFVRYPIIIRTLLKTFFSLRFFHKPTSCLVTRSQSWIVITKRSTIIYCCSGYLPNYASDQVYTWDLILFLINFWTIRRTFLKPIILIRKRLDILIKTSTFIMFFSFTHNIKTFVLRNF